MEIPPYAYGFPKNQHGLSLQVPIKMVVSYMQKYMIFNLKIIISMIYV
jgi:hypothetical protein